MQPTNNFISMKLVTAMGQAAQEAVEIELANGYKTRSKGHAQYSEMKVDIDLGMTWLNSIGALWVDWLRIYFKVVNRIEALFWLNKLL